MPHTTPTTKKAGTTSTNSSGPAARKSANTSSLAAVEPSRRQVDVAPVLVDQAAAGAPAEEVQEGGAEQRGQLEQGEGFPERHPALARLDAQQQHDEVAR